MNGATGRRHQHDKTRGLIIFLFVLSAMGISSHRAHADADAMLAEAESHYSVGEYEQALTVVGQVLADAGTSVEQRLDTYVLRARCLAQLRRMADAKSAFTDAIRINDSWRPDSVLMPDKEEQALFYEALAEYQPSQMAPVSSPAASEAPTPRDCPSLKTPLVATGVLAAATIYFIVAKKQAGERWDEYAADPLRSVALYDEYESAWSRQKTAGAVSVACGLATGYVWWKYRKQNRNCSDAEASIPAVSLGVAPDGFMVGWRF